MTDRPLMERIEAELAGINQLLDELLTDDNLDIQCHPGRKAKVENMQHQLHLLIDELSGKPAPTPSTSTCPHCGAKCSEMHQAQCLVMKRNELSCKDAHGHPMVDCRKVPADMPAKDPTEQSGDQ